jgi:hypothetical protein
MQMTIQANRRLAANVLDAIFALRTTIALLGYPKSMSATTRAGTYNSSGNWIAELAYALVTADSDSADTL